MSSLSYATLNVYLARSAEQGLDLDLIPGRPLQEQDPSSRVDYQLAIFTTNFGFPNRSLLVLPLPLYLLPLYSQL
jgi:hypothetical protein